MTKTDISRISRQSLGRLKRENHFGGFCPNCQSYQSSVIATRNDGQSAANGRALLGSIRRRRLCRKCGEKFTTYEFSEHFAQSALSAQLARPGASLIERILELSQPQKLEILAAIATDMAKIK